MNEENEMLTLIGTFDNVNVRNDGIVNMRLKFPYSEIAKYTLLLLNIGIKLKAIIMAENEKIKLGNIIFKSLSINRDGEARFVIEGNSTEVQLEKIYLLLDKAIVLKIKKLGGN